MHYPRLGPTRIDELRRDRVQVNPTQFILNRLAARPNILAPTVKNKLTSIKVVRIAQSSMGQNWGHSYEKLNFSRK
jgi:hypothetical protein